MVRPLRNYHFWLWRILAVLLPSVLLLAVLVRPQSEKAVKSEKDIEFSYALASDTSLVLSFRVTKPLTAPSCLVLSEAGKNTELLGIISKQGQYTFMARRSTTNIILRDGLHQKNIITYTIDKL